MNELISWLVNIEKLAAKVYKQASTHFSEDKKLSDLMNSLHDEEQDHSDIMSKISTRMSENYNLFTLIKIDATQQEKIENNFNICLEGLNNRSLSKYDFLEAVVENECSEWNDLFMYVVGIYKESDNLSKILGIQMQRHKRMLERYLETYPEYNKLVSKLKSLPNTWEEKFLVVDDEEAICDLIATALEKEGSVDCVYNGEEALKMIGSNYYTAIISDVNMPQMNGIELYDKIAEIFPNMKDRFIFCTGNREEHESYFKLNGVKSISKPAPLPEIRDEIISIVHKRRYQV